MTCESCAPILEENKILKQILKEHEERIAVLEKLLKIYHNAHTPSSQKKFGKKPKKDSGKKGKPGQKKGHKGVTRSKPAIDKTIPLTAKKCRNCRSKNLILQKTISKIIEEIPKNLNKLVVEYLQNIYQCPDCGVRIVTKHDDLPKEGMMGKNVTSQVTMMKYADRMPCRKIRKSLLRQHGFDLSGATILDLTRRASEAMRPEYEKIMERIRSAGFVHADETGMKVDGRKCWIWVFASGSDVMIVASESRGKDVIEKTLGKNFDGIIICDGWKPYSSFTDKIQRCWAHLLREADELADDYEDAKALSEELHSIFYDCKLLLEDAPPPDKRKMIKKAMEARMKQAIGMDFGSRKMRKFAKKVMNGYDFWFTFVLHPYIEPTNNIGENALRESVVQRKIIGTLRNEKGMFMHETAMSVIPTWENMGLNPHEELMKLL